jgi:hypothetical protein
MEPRNDSLALPANHSIETGVCENKPLCLSILALVNLPPLTCWSTFLDSSLLTTT